MEDQRKHIRFQPDEDTYIIIKLEDDTIYSGLCIDESQSGSAGVFINHYNFTPGKMCLMKVGKLDAISAEIKWVTELDNDVVKIGFSHLA